MNMINTRRILAAALVTSSLVAAPIAEARHGRNTAFVAGLLSGAVLSHAHSNHRAPVHHHHHESYRGGYRSAKRRCAARYRSYDWDSDTIVTHSGRVRTCKYVRPYL
jgi:hypothetical protein